MALLVYEELPDTALPCADVGEEFLQALDAPVGECGDALFAAVTAT
ncbi:hypothetical protein [Agrobacterium pusense]|nr:hypothetical protein [Agrobacterium pusense]QKJ94336.1 hypothetical protein HQN82_23840 [Agrobacterium pusense]